MPVNGSNKSLMNALRGASLHTLVQAMIYAQDHVMQSNNNIYFLREELDLRPVHEPLEAAYYTSDTIPAEARRVADAGSRHGGRTSRVVIRRGRSYQDYGFPCDAGDRPLYFGLRISLCLPPPSSRPNVSDALLPSHGPAALSFTNSSYFVLF